MSKLTSYPIHNGKYLHTTKLPKHEAIAMGLEVYWPEKRCQNDHLDFRTLSRNRCTACIRAGAARAQRKKHFSDKENIEANTARRKAEALKERLELLKEVWD